MYLGCNLKPESQPEPAGSSVKMKSTVRTGVALVCKWNSTLNPAVINRPHPELCAECAEKYTLFRNVHFLVGWATLRSHTECKFSDVCTAGPLAVSCLHDSVICNKWSVCQQTRPIALSGRLQGKIKRQGLPFWQQARMEERKHPVWSLRREDATRRRL